MSYQEAVDTSTPAGQMMFTMISAFAQFERSIIQERVKAGLAKARAKGKKLGRPKLEIDETRVLELRAKGLSIRKMAQEMGYKKSRMGEIVKQIES